MKKLKKENYKFDVSKEIMKYSPSDYSLLTILRVKEKYENDSEDIFPVMAKCGNPKFKWVSGNKIVENYLQIFRTDFSDLKNKKKEAIKHLKEIENVFWNGERELCPACGKIKSYWSDCNIDKPGVRKTGGVIQFLKENKSTFKLKKNFSKKDFNSFLRKGFIYGDDTKMLFADEESFKHLSRICKGKFSNKHSMRNSYGFNKNNVNRLFEPWGTVNIIKTPSLSSGTICLLDMKNVYYRYLNQRDTHLLVNLQKLKYQDVDAPFKVIQAMRKKLKPKHTYLQECGLLITAFENHLLGIIKTDDKKISTK